MFGVCYYPEHWPEIQWAKDAQMMAGLGLRYVRIGEFAWSRMEPAPGQYQFDWLDRAVATLADAGLQVVMCTPTATPPKWLVDKYPEVLPVDPATGQQRGFGSRRHYDFSSPVYLRESLRISAELAKRYGSLEAVVGWQTDNELCCHETTLSGSMAARQGFQAWCRARYPSIAALNTAWGNVFWSMEYRDFSEIELPILAVTECNPAHSLAYRRYSSDQVIKYHAEMVAVIRQHAHGKWVTHNFIPLNETGVDNAALAAPLDFASYDNYPLGRTDQMLANESPKTLARHMRVGHPDLPSYHLDQIRGLKGKGFWVMEQQPGAVNWARHNPRPAPGMVRLWTLQAFAHGADVVSYFRWRQAPFAQEQMHAGLLRVDNSKTEAWQQIEQLRVEVAQLQLATEAGATARVAILSDDSCYQVSDIEVQGAGYDYDSVQFDFYSALRELGLNVDFINAAADLGPYALVVVPGLPIVDAQFVSKCKVSDAVLVFGPRSGAKTDDFTQPMNLPPGLLQDLLPLRVLAVETLRADCHETFSWQGQRYTSKVWREQLDAPDMETLAQYDNGEAAIVGKGKAVYMATVTDTTFLRDFFKAQCDALGITLYDLGPDVRVQRRGDWLFAFNYSEQVQELPLADEVKFLLGGRKLAAHDVAIWRV